MTYVYVDWPDEREDRSSHRATVSKPPGNAKALAKQAVSESREIEYSPIEHITNIRLAGIRNEAAAIGPAPWAPRLHVMTESGDKPKEFPIQLVWPEGLADAAQVVNQFVLANDLSDPGALYLLLGHAATPVYLDQAHLEQRLQERGSALPISARGSFYMTRENAEKLRDIIDKHLKKGDK
jgi:hypothetical protein